MSVLRDRHRRRDLVRWLVWPCVAMLAAACALPRAGPSGPDAVRLRVMTWNIAAGRGDLPGIAAVIRGARPDILALQEVDVRWSERSGFEDQAAALGRALDMDVRFAPIYQLPGGEAAPLREFGVAILSRHPIVEFRNLVIPRLSTQSNDTDVQPMPGFAMAVIDVGGVPVRVFSTHLDYRADPRVRVLQVAATLDLIAERPDPAVLMGDFNAPPSAAELAPLFGRWRDVWPAGDDAGFTYPAEAPIRRIDYILTSPPVRARDVRVLVVQASDHRPVVADLSVVRPRARRRRTPRALRAGRHGAGSEASTRCGNQGLAFAPRGRVPRPRDPGRQCGDIGATLR